MKFKVAVEIHKPIAQVTKYFADPQYLDKYQDGFIRKDFIRGTEGQNGAVSKMYYKHGKNEMELTETITANQLPASFEAHYHHKHMDNTMKSNFTALSENSTLYESEIHYTRISWVLPKLMALLFPGMFKKQVEKWLNNFKVFVESSEADSD